MAKKLNSYANANVLLALKQLLQQKKVGTQEEISEALLKQGFKVNQVKVSRLLQKLRAIKITENHRTVYQLASQLAPSVAPTDSLKHLIISIKHNQSLIVIQTTPGSAPLIARLMDQKREIGILGTVAGDDTIFIAPESSQRIVKIMQKIEEILD